MKSCSICHKLQLLSEFNKNKLKKDGLQPHCRTCNRERSRAYYARNKEQHKQTTKIRKLENQKVNRQLLWEYLLENPCVECGESDPLVLDFDHLRDKVRNISTMIDCAWSTILNEIAKCQVLCANCHRRKTAKDFSWYALQVGPEGTAPSSPD